jgi:HEAT repeat protein
MLTAGRSREETGRNGGLSPKLRMTITTDDPLPDLVRSLRSRTAADRLRAAKGLARLGWLAREALPALVGTLGDEDAKVREAAAQAVGQMGSDALPALVSMLAHPDKYVRRNAVWALGKLGPVARPALRDLCKALKDADPRTATGAAQSLGNLGADGVDSIPALTEAMRGTNIVLCRLAAKALSQIGPPAISTLIAHLQHSDSFVRGEAALALGWIGPAARSAVPFLAQVVRGPQSRALQDTPAPSQTLAGLGGHPSATLTPTLPPIPDENSAEESCRVYAAQALGRIGPTAVGAVADLREAARHGPDPLRHAALHALRTIQGQ